MTPHPTRSYMKDGLQPGNKMNSLARSNASLYKGGPVPPPGHPGAPGGPGGPGGNEDLYDRLRRHAYQGKKSGTTHTICPLISTQKLNVFLNFFFQTRAVTRPPATATDSEGEEKKERATGNGKRRNSDRNPRRQRTTNNETIFSTKEKKIREVAANQKPSLKRNNEAKAPES